MPLIDEQLAQVEPAMEDSEEGELPVELPAELLVELPVEPHPRIMAPQIPPMVHCLAPNCGYNTPIGIDDRRALELLKIHVNMAHQNP